MKRQFGYVQLLLAFTIFSTFWGGLALLFINFLTETSGTF